jgi:hypothetical protein
MRAVVARALSLAAALFVLGAVEALKALGCPYPVEDCLLAAVVATAGMMIGGWRA